MSKTKKDGSRRTTRSTTDVEVDVNLLAAVRVIIREELQSERIVMREELKASLNEITAKVDKGVSELNSLTANFKQMEIDVEDCSNRVETMTNLRGKGTGRRKSD